MNDSFWFVRQKAVEAIRLFKDEDMVSFLKSKCRDKKSKVRVAALKSLGEYKSKELVSFLKERFEKDDSYLAQAEALRSIGKCGDKSIEKYLEKAAKMKSPRNVVQRAAEWAISQIGGK